VASDYYLLQYASYAIASILLGAVPFALLAGAITRIVVRCDPRRAAWFSIATLAAYGLAALSGIALSYLTRGMAVRDIDRIVGIVGGFIAGFIGSGAMASAAGWLWLGPRDAARWWSMLAVGTALGALLAVDMIRESNYVFVLFPIWQSAVAVTLFLTLRHWQQVRTGSA
jgi:hypothetical protein